MPNTVPAAVKPTSQTTPTLAADVPATFLPASDQCEAHTWCVLGPDHTVECQGTRVSMPVPGRADRVVLEAAIVTDLDSGETAIEYASDGDSWNLVSSDELRGEAAKARAAVARLYALADEYDAVREAEAAEQRGPAPAPAPKQSVGRKPKALRAHTFESTEGSFTEVCPSWCKSQHIGFDDRGPDWRPDPKDITHMGTVFDGVPMHAFHEGEVGGKHYFRMFSAYIEQRPHAWELGAAVPTAGVSLVEENEFVPGIVVEGMDPDQLETLIGRLDAGVSDLRRVHAQLVAARSEYRRTARRQPAACHHSWCTATDEHEEHQSGWIDAPGKADILDATIYASGDNAPVVAFLGGEFTPTEAREQALALRDHLNVVLGLAETVECTESERARS